jgi:hypothetical protein
MAPQAAPEAMTVKASKTAVKIILLFIAFILCPSLCFMQAHFQLEKIIALTSGSEGNFRL